MSSIADKIKYRLFVQVFGCTLSDSIAHEKGPARSEPVQETLEETFVQR